MVIYKVKNRICGKVYIGKYSEGSSATRRWRRHINSAIRGSKTYFHRAIKKYGEDNFTVSILRSRIRTLKRLNHLEKKYIRKFKSNDKRYGYNLTAGGDGSLGCYPNLATRRKLSKSQKGRKGTMLGKKHSVTTRRKMSKSHTGVKRGEYPKWWRRRISEAMKRSHARRRSSK